MSTDPITREKIDELLQFLPLFESPGRDFVAWSFRRGGMAYPEDVTRFFMLAGQPCWSDYDYVLAEASRMLEDEAEINRATLAEIKTMLTFCVRGERFSTGHWGAMLESGKVVAILRRLQALREQI